MQEENIRGFDAIGFRVSVVDKEQFTHLLKSLWYSSQQFPALLGQAGCTSGDYFRLWTHIHDAGIEHVLESNPMPGLVGQFESYVDTDLIKIWVWDREKPDSEEPLYPLCLRSPIPWFINEQAALDLGTVSLGVTVVSDHAEFFDDKVHLSRHQELGKFAEESVVPTGMFVEEGESPSAGVMVIGRVLLAVRAANEISNDEFFSLRVRTLGGEVFVNLPLEAVESDVTGKIIAVQGAASGTSPECIPAPVEREENLDENGKSIEFTGEAFENELRQMCIDFWGTRDFKSYLKEIHLTRLQRVCASVFGAFNSELIGATKRRGKATWGTARRYRKAFLKGPIVIARIVMANTMVLYEGISSPALVVIAFGEGAQEAMDKARSVLARIHFGEANTPEEMALAKTIEDEEYQFGKRRKLPTWLVGDVEAYAADVWIPSVAAHEEGLMTEALVCFAQPGKRGLTATVPANLLIEAHRLVKKSGNYMST